MIELIFTIIVAMVVFIFLKPFMPFLAGMIFMYSILNIVGIAYKMSK